MRGGSFAAVGLLLASSLLAGCSGDGNAPQATAPATGPGEGAAANLTVLRHSLMAPYAKTVWANGSVAAQDTCNTGGCVVDQRAFRVTDITGDVPKGAPVRVEVELAYDPLGVPVGGGFEAWVQSEDAVFYSYDYDGGQAGTVQVVAVLRAAGTVEVVMAAYGPGGGTPETAYTLRISVFAHPELLPDGVPAALRLGPGATVRATSTEGDGSAFFLYDPDDRPVGRFDGSHTLPATAPAGDYVILVPSAEPWARVATDAGSTGMAALGLRMEMGPEGTVPQYGAYDDEWEVTGTPIGVGVAAFSPGSVVGGSPLASAGYSMRLSGPNGFDLDTGTLCGLCLNFGSYRSTWGSGLGDERVTAGTYSIHVESQGTYELRAHPYAVYFARS